MDTRFVLPVTTAAALHAFLFWGIGGTRPPGDTSPKPASPTRTFVETFILPPEPPANDPEPFTAPAKGSADAERPSLPDDARPTECNFEMPALPNYPPPKNPVSQISFEPPGDPNGIVEGVQNAKIVDSIHLDNKPRTRSQTPPAYPMEARHSGLTGEVWVEFVVDQSGHVKTARVVRSSSSIFESATLRAVQLWRFEPGKRNGRPVSFRMVAPVVFSLND